MSAWAEILWKKKFSTQMNFPILSFQITEKKMKRKTALLSLGHFHPLAVITGERERGGKEKKRSARGIFIVNNIPAAGNRKILRLLYDGGVGSVAPLFSLCKKERKKKKTGWNFCFNERLYTSVCSTEIPFDVEKLIWFFFSFSF